MKSIWERRFHRLWENFLPPFLATISGVSIAFVLDRIVDWIYRIRNRRKLLHDLHSELVEIKSKLYPKTKSVPAIYPDIWDSAVSSGAIRLLNSDKIIKITRIYYYIKGTHSEAGWIRRAIEEFNSVPPTEKEKREWLKNRYQELWVRHFERGKDLSQRIEALLKEEWWE